MKPGDSISWKPYSGKHVVTGVYHGVLGDKILVAPDSHFTPPWKRVGNYIIKIDPRNVIEDD